METPHYFTVGPEVQTGEVEVGQIVTVADVEEEMGGPAVVAVLEEFDQWELKEVLVEPDCPFDVAAEHCKVM
jgi:hypothetical protein